MPNGFSRAAKKAPWVGAFFVCIAWQANLYGETCSAPQQSEPVRVRFVYDGDTLVLTDERKIRLIGINAPETAQDGRPAEPLSVAARDRLRQMLSQQNDRAQLIYGVEKRDRHGRTLAHLWLPDDRNLTAELLRQGMGWAIAVPPNIRLLDCYLAAEKAARAAGRGVWSHPELEARPASQLDARNRGFLRVSGRVTRVGHGGGATWINLQGRFAVRIPDKHLRWFHRPPDRSWVDKDLEVRGWLYAAKGELRMTVRHPADLELRARSGWKGNGS